MKKLIYVFTGIVIGTVSLVYAATPALTTPQGGTGTTSPSGILYGDGTIRLKTVTLGSNCTFVAGVLNCAGGGSGSIGTSTTPVIGDLSYWTAWNTLGTVATGTISSGAGISVTAGQSIIGSGLTITNTSPDQTVTLNNGTGISVVGTYPTFTINNTGLLSYDSWTHPLAGQSATTSTLLFPQAYISSSSIGNLTAGLITSTTTGNNYFAGNVGIGTTSPFASLSVSPTLNDSSGRGYGIVLSPVINQSGTAGYSALYINTISNSTGSSFKDLIAAGVNGTIKFEVGDDGAISSAVGIKNSTSQSNAYLQTTTNGLVFSRNRIDSNPVTIIQNLYSGSTGDILQLKNSSSTVMTVMQSGLIGISSTSPWALLSVNATSSSNTNLFVVATSTGTATSTAFVIDSNGKVGIGTTTPSGTNSLAVEGSAYFDGKVGIGTAAPGVTLDVLGPHVATIGLARFKGSGNSGFMSLDTSGSQAASEAGFLLKLGGVKVGQFATDNTNRVSIYNNVYNDATPIMVLTSTGNVGIGTTSPYAKLSVVGNIVGSNITATSTLSLPSLATPAGAFLAISSTGQVISTSTPVSGAASTTLLANSNTFSGVNMFTGDTFFGNPVTFLDIINAVDIIGEYTRGLTLETPATIEEDSSGISIGTGSVTLTSTSTSAALGQVVLSPNSVLTLPAGAIGANSGILLGKAAWIGDTGFDTSVKNTLIIGTSFYDLIDEMQVATSTGGDILLLGGMGTTMGQVGIGSQASGKYGFIRPDNLTDNRNYDLPDKSGTFAIASSTGNGAEEALVLDSADGSCHAIVVSNLNVITATTVTCP